MSFGIELILEKKLNEKDYFKVTANKKTFYFLAINSLVLIDDDNSIIIHEDVWHNKQNQVKSRIHSLLGLNKKIHARLCKIKNISAVETKLFLDENHTQGYCASAYKYGLFYNEELIAVATFSKGRRMNRLLAHQRSFELLLFATKNYTTVVGGFDKLLRHFETEKKPADIMTYVDAEWSNGNSFINLGFSKIELSKPITFYIDENFIRYKISIEKPLATITNKGNWKFIKSVFNCDN